MLPEIGFNFHQHEIYENLSNSEYENENECSVISSGQQAVLIYKIIYATWAKFLPRVIQISK